MNEEIQSCNITDLSDPTKSPIFRTKKRTAKHNFAVLLSFYSLIKTLISSDNVCGAIREPYVSKVRRNIPHTIS